MDITNPLELAISKVGLVAMARGLQVTHQAVRKWQRMGRMPRTEWTGETHYSETIERLTYGAVPNATLLEPWSVGVDACARPALSQDGSRGA